MISPLGKYNNPCISLLKSNRCTILFGDLELANTTKPTIMRYLQITCNLLIIFITKYGLHRTYAIFFNNDLEFANLNLGQVYDTTSGHFYVRYERPIFLHKKGIDRTQILNLFFSMTMNLLK